MAPKQPSEQCQTVSSFPQFFYFLIDQPGVRTQNSSQWATAYCRLFIVIEISATRSPTRSIMMKLRQRMFFALAAFLLLAVGTAQAQITLVTVRSSLGGTDFIDWGQLGLPFSQTVTPVNVLSNNSHTVNVNQAVSPMERRDQGNGWSGNFANGDRLWWTDNAPNGGGPITINFGASATAFGANIQADSFGAFVARLSFFDVFNNLVGTVTETGNSTNAGDGSAIFIGGISGGTATNFNSVVISLDSAVGPTADFAINQADFSLATGVPEPTSVALVGITFVTGAGVWWQRRRKMQKLMELES
jgi:hypothetical protein